MGLGHRRRRRSRRRLVPAVLAAALLLAACGTRLPDDAFTRAAADTAGASGSVAGASDAPISTATRSADPVGGDGSPPAEQHRAAAAVRPASTPDGGGPAGNTASDVGVTPTSVVVGNIVSQTNAFDPRAFIGPYYGARAYFNWLNTHGGVHGRKVVLARCDDQGTGTGNSSCVRNLIDNSRVFAFAGNAILSYAGAAYVNAKGVPDVAGQPIDTAYYQYPHLWDIYAEDYPRNGDSPGFGGTIYNGTEVYRYFKVHFPDVPRKAGVVYYNDAQSSRYAQGLQKGLTTEGYDVTMKMVNFALPDFDSAVIAMKQAGVRYVYDALDRAGNERLCKAMDDHALDVTAKVTTTQSWEASIGADYSASPTCRNSIWAWSKSRSYEDTRYPGVARFRAEMAREHGDAAQTLSQWALEGWASAQWLTDAMRSCGARLTRACVEAYLSRPTDYDGHGLLTPRRYERPTSPPKTVRNCLNVARWQDSAHGWVTQVGDMDHTCFTTPNVGYAG